MKKSLVALAALAATTAFAQSSVTLSGNIDFAYANVGGSQLWAKGSTVSTTVGTASTSVINIVAVEDLGGGMKVTGKYGIDPRTLANDSYAVTNNTGLANTYGGQVDAKPGIAAVTGNTAASSTANSTLGSVGGQANTATGFARDEVFVGIEGGFGNLRLGAPNSIGLNSFQVASPAGTGIGSGYTGAGTSGTMTNSFVQTRYNRSVRYDSPVLNGFTLSYQYAPGNDQAATFSNTAALTGTSGAIAPANTTPNAFLIPNARAATEYGVRYANGPLTVSYANVAQDVQNNSTGWYATGTSTKGLKTSVNLLNASYVMGNTTLYVGWNDGDRLAPIGSAGSSATANVATKGNRMAIKQTMGKLDVMASITTQEALGVTASAAGQTGAAAFTTKEIKAKVTGLRAEYNLSKTAAIYGGYEKYETGADYNTTALTSTGNRTLTSIGLKKSF